MQTVYTIQRLLDLIGSHNFHRFQHDLVWDWYTGLEEGYSIDEVEEKLVERLVNLVNQQSRPKTSPQVHLGAKFIHGHRSMVKYVDFRNESRECELCDMAVVSAVMDNKKLLL